MYRDELIFYKIKIQATGKMILIYLHFQNKHSFFQNDQQEKTCS